MQFQKVSRDIFEGSGGCPHCYDHIKLPARATKGSAGYDFFAPDRIFLPPKADVVVPTGIRAKMENGSVLLIFPRSGLGFKYGLSLANTVGVIDADYYFSDNQGHIMIKIVNGGGKDLEIKKGSAFAQGIFLRYDLTDDDKADQTRNGGFGSTDE